MHYYIHLDEIIKRHPFPGPGLAIRILGSVTTDKVSVLQEVDDIFISDPSWNMEYNNWVEKNTYRYKTVIPMKPAKSENPEDAGKTGEAIFRFNVYDKQNYKNLLSNELQFEKSLWVLKCGDGLCSSAFENDSTCVEDCGE